MSNQLFKNCLIDGLGIDGGRSGMNGEQAEIIAAQAFGFLAGDRDRIARFLQLTGLTPDALAEQAGDPAFLAGVLDHLMSDDALVLTFCANAGLRPGDVVQAHRALTLGRGAHEGSA
jgi:hypothetical protein